MEQVIKFRALKDDMSNCIFMYGQLVYDAIGQPRITEIDSSGKGLTFHTCLKGTEGQFTGLLDKHGKEIYCGDILKGVSYNTFSKGQSDNYEVMWGVDGWHIKGTYFSIQELRNYCNNDIEIIGNIHQNSK